MEEENINKDKKEVNEPVSVYKPTKKQGIDENFDFDEAFKSGLTPEEFRKEMHKRINAFPWKK